MPLTHFAEISINFEPILRSIQIGVWALNITQIFSYIVLIGIVLKK